MLSYYIVCAKLRHSMHNIAKHQAAAEGGAVRHIQMKRTGMGHTSNVQVVVLIRTLPVSDDLGPWQTPSVMA